MVKAMHCYSWSHMEKRDTRWDPEEKIGQLTTKACLDSGREKGSEGPKYFPLNNWQTLMFRRDNSANNARCNSFFLSFLFPGSGASPGDAQELFLSLYSGITSGNAHRIISYAVLNPGWLCAKQAPYLLYYHWIIVSKLFIFVCFRVISGDA